MVSLYRSKEERVNVKICCGCDKKTKSKTNVKGTCLLGIVRKEGLELIKERRSFFVKWRLCRVCFVYERVRRGHVEETRGEETREKIPGRRSQGEEASRVIKQIAQLKRKARPWSPSGCYAECCRAVVTLLADGRAECSMWVVQTSLLTRTYYPS